MEHPSLIIQRALEGGEELLWTGTPRYGLSLRTEDLVALPQALLWLAVAAYWMLAKLPADAPEAYQYLGVPFAIYGLYLLIVRPLLDARGRKYTWYGLSDRRLVIVTGRKRRVTSVNLTDITDIGLKAHRDGTGTLFLAVAVEERPRFAGLPGPRAERVLGARLEAIEHPKHVLGMIEEARSMAIKGTGQGAFGW